MVARKLRYNKVQNMNRLAIMGKGIGSSIEAFKSKNILMLDGCPTECGKRILDKYGFTDYKYLRVTDLDYKKEQTPVTDEVVNAVYAKSEVIY